MLAGLIEFMLKLTPITLISEEKLNSTSQTEMSLPQDGADLKTMELDSEPLPSSNMPKFFSKTTKKTSSKKISGMLPENLESSNPIWTMLSNHGKPKLAIFGKN